MTYEQAKREIKKEANKELILTILIGAFILVATFMLLCSLNNKFVSDCTKAGHSQSYCERGL